MSHQNWKLELFQKTGNRKQEISYFYLPRFDKFSFSFIIRTPRPPEHFFRGAGAIRHCCRSGDAVACPLAKHNAPESTGEWNSFFRARICLHLSEGGSSLPLRTLLFYFTQALPTCAKRDQKAHLLPVMAETWYYVDDTTNSQQGPCTVPELGRLLASSSIGDSTLVWKDGQPGWEALSSLSSLHAQVMAARGGPPALPAKTLPPLPAKPRAAAGGGSGYSGGGGGGAYAAAQASAPVVQSMSGLYFGFRCALF